MRTRRALANTQGRDGPLAIALSVKSSCARHLSPGPGAFHRDVRLPLSRADSCAALTRSRVSGRRRPHVTERKRLLRGDRTRRIAGIRTHDYLEERLQWVRQDFDEVLEKLTDGVLSWRPTEDCSR